MIRALWRGQRRFSCENSASSAKTFEMGRNRRKGSRQVTWGSYWRAAGQYVPAAQSPQSARTCSVGAAWRMGGQVLNGYLHTRCLPRAPAACHSNKTAGGLRKASWS